MRKRLIPLLLFSTGLLVGAPDTRTNIKSWFETGDIPTQGQFSTTWDSTAFLSEADTVTGNWSFTGSPSFAGLTSSGLISFTGTDHAGVRLNSLTQVQRDALTPVAGDLVWVTTIPGGDHVSVYDGSAWSRVGGTWGTLTGLPSDNASVGTAGEAIMADEAESDVRSYLGLDTSDSPLFNNLQLSGELDLETTDTTTIAGLRLKSLTDAERATVTPLAGNLYMNTTGGVNLQYYDGTAWVDIQDGAETSPKLPGGAPGDVQYHAATANFAGEAAFNYNDATNALVVAGSIQVGDASADGTLIVFDDDAGGDAGVTIQAPDALGTGYTLTLPGDDGAANQFLQTNGSGVLTWASETAEVNDLSAAVTWVNVPDANVTSSSVVQHEDNFATLTASTSVTVGTASSDGVLVLSDDDAGGDATVTIQPVDALGTSYTLTLPPNDGTAGQVLETDGAGVLTWEDAASGGTPGGADTQFQYNNAGAFGGVAEMIWDNTDKSVDVGSGVGVFTNEGTALKPKLHVLRDNTSSEPNVILQSVSDSLAPAFYLARERVTGGAVADTDTLGQIWASGHDGTDYERAADIRFFVDGTVAANQVPSRMEVRVTDAAGSNVTALNLQASLTTLNGRIDIDGAGNSVLIGNNAGAADDFSSNTNVAIGNNTMLAATTSSDLVVIGEDALKAQVTGAVGSIAIGHGSAEAMNDSSFDGSVVIGSEAADAATATDANAHVIIGEGAMGVTLDLGSGNVVIGERAAEDLSSGDDNVVAGRNAGLNLGVSNFGVVIGATAADVATTAGRAVVIGYNAAGASATVGSSSVIIGDSAAQNDATAADLVVIGEDAGADGLGGGSVAIGADAGGNQTGIDNVFVGMQSGFGSDGLSDGTGNTAIGDAAGNDITTGDNNVFVGSNAGDVVTTASESVAVGRNALGEMVTGIRNIGIGSQAGGGAITGAQNVFIGYSVDPQDVTASNRLIINNLLFGNGWATGTTFANGEIGINVDPVNADGSLQVKQPEATGGKPVAHFEQLDVSEEIFEFKSTVGAGNAIEADSTEDDAKYGTIKVVVDGVGTKYIRLYDGPS